MKIKITILLFAVTMVSYGQWKYDSGNDKFDGDYKMAYVVGKGSKFPYNEPVFVIGNYDGKQPRFILTDFGYTGCDGNTIKITFGDGVIYEVSHLVDNNESDALYILDFYDITLLDFVELMKKKSKMYVRFNSNCSSKDMEFGLSGSGKAIDRAISEWIGEQKELEEEEEAELTPIIEYYKSLGCEDLLDTIKPMYTDYIESTSPMFDTLEGKNGFLSGTLVNIKNSNRSKHKIKVWATKDNKTEEFHLTPEEARKAFNEHDVINAMDVGLTNFWKRMEKCD